MPLVYRVILIVVGVWMIFCGVFMIYQSLKKPKFGEGYTLRKLKELEGDEQH